MLDKEYFFALADREAYDEARIYLERFKIVAEEDSFYYANMGWILNHLERYEEAQICLLRGIYFFPAEAFLYAQYGYSLRCCEKYEDALSSLKKALRLGMDERWIHLELADCYQALQEWEKAIDSYENVLLEEEDDLWTLARCAEIYERIGKTELAEEYLWRVWKLTKSPAAGWSVADFYNRQKNYEKEILILSEMRPKDAVEEETDYERMFRLALAYEKQGDYDNAIALMERLITWNDKEAQVHGELSRIYQALGDEKLSLLHYHQALQCYEKLLQGKREEADAVYRELIWLTHIHADWKRKLVYLQRMTRYFEKDCWMMYHFAKTYSELQQFEEASACCEYCLKYFDEDCDILELYAWILGRNQKEEKALLLLKRRIELFGDSVWVWEEMGWNYVNLKHFTQAAHSFLRAEELASPKPFYHALAGWSIYQDGDAEAALPYLLKALEDGAEEAWLYVTIAEAYRELEEPKKAIEYFQLGKELGFSAETIEKEIAAVEEQMAENEGRSEHVR